MNWLGFKNSGWQGKTGTLLVFGGLGLALISAIIFVSKIPGKDFKKEIDPTIWGQFGDFLGGTWGVLLTAGSAMLIVETIRKQDEHERIRAFESQFFFLVKEQKKLQAQLLSNRWFFDSIEKIKSNIVTFYSTREFTNHSEPPPSKVLLYYYLVEFGKSCNYTDNGLNEKLNEISDQFKGFFQSRRYGDYSMIDSDKGKILTDTGNFNTQNMSLQFSTYLRHLFGIYSYLNNNSLLTLDEKLTYSRIVRSSLTTEEQFIIFLNSLSPLGANWEISGDNQVSNNKMLITKYSLIRNIPKEYLYKIAVHEFYPAIKFEWMDKTPDARKSLKFT